MAQTERIYYTQAYRTRCQSKVVSSSDDGLRVILDSTVFYPASGGQPHDIGTLNGLPVVDVLDQDGVIVHVLASPLTDWAVEQEIDWKRRYDHMQQHTGQHLLSAVFEDLYAIPTLSFHMGSEVSSIELGTKDLTLAQNDAVIRRATELARGNPAISVTFEDALQTHDLRKASTRTGNLRIVEIAGIDRSACGGTHVASLAEVLPLQLRDMDRVRGNVRLSFVCGDRAIARSQSDYVALSSLAKNLAVPLEQAGSQVALVQQRLSDSEKQRQHLELEAATRAGIALYTSADPYADGKRRVVASETAIDECERAKARSYAAQPNAILLMHSAESLLIACSVDSGVNAGAVLKQALAKFGARGGGSPTLAQGRLPGESILSELRQALGF